MKNSNDFDFNHIYLDFIMSLANCALAKKILVVGPILDIENFPTSFHDKITVISEERQLIDKSENIGDFDLTIIAPRLGGTANKQNFPRDWQENDAVSFSSEDVSLAWGIHLTKKHGQIISITTNGLLNNTSRLMVRKKLIQEGLETVIALGAIFKSSSINTTVLVFRRGKVPNELRFLDISQVPEDIDWVALGNAVRRPQNIDTSISNLWFSKVQTESLDENIRLDPNFYHPKFLQIEPPQGYEEHLLADLVDIFGGRSRASLKDTLSNSERKKIPFVQVSNITADGSLSIDFAKLYSTSDDSKLRAGWAGPNDILITTSGTLGKACIVSEKHPDGVFFDTSIRRLRVKHESVDNQLIYEFLHTEIAQLQIEQYASGSVIPLISTSNLGNIRVFVPTFSNEGDTLQKAQREKIAKDSFAKTIARTLQEKIVIPLQNIDPSIDMDWRKDVIDNLREIMGQIQKDHEPLENIIRYYPLPIAIAYRRMMRAYHNPYEQVGRLIELYETLTYFFYYVLLSDAISNKGFFKNLKESEKQIINLAKQYKNISMANRLEFINILIEKAKVKNDQIQLFMPELLDIDVYSLLNSLRYIRNTHAHSTAGASDAQKAIFNEHWPSIKKLLIDLRFLQNYPLCRIESFYTKNNQTVFRAEFFQGAMYETDVREQKAPTTENGQVKLIKADHRHIILLNPQFDWLDLHPFYQVINLPEFMYESHFCFYKAIKLKTNKINGVEIKTESMQGESIQIRKEFELPGIDDLKKLVQSAGLPG